MKRLMLGNEAIARGAYEAGTRVVTAYPGTPSTEITEYAAQYPELNTEWSVNEKVALEIGIGSCIAGARTLVAMKHVGLNVAMDPLLSISYPGVSAGLVIVKRTGGNAGAVSIQVAATDGTNAVNGRDYLAFTNTLVIQTSSSLATGKTISWLDHDIRSLEVHLARVRPISLPCQPADWPIASQSPAL